MSGTKRTTVSVDQEHLRALQISDQQLRAMRQDLPEILQNIRNSSMADMQQHLRPIEERQNQFSQAVSNLHQDVVQFARETAEQLSNQQQEFRYSLDQVHGEVRDLAHATAHQFEEQRREFHSKLAQQRQILESQIHEVENRVGRIEDREQRLRELAQHWLQLAEISLDCIAQNPRHQQFIPGKQEQQRREIQAATKFLNQEASEAALMKAQNSAQQLADLMLELQQKEEEWLLWRSDCAEKVQTLQTLAANSRHAVMFDMNGEPLQERADVNYWTNGKLTAYETWLSELLSKVTDETSALSTADLKQLVESEMPRLGEELDTTIQEARADFLGSQLRIDIADLVMEALVDQGFEVEGGTYRGEDFRSDYVAKAVHLDGGEVSVRVAPIEGQPGKNEVTINSFDADDLQSEELEARRKEIHQVLSESNLMVGNTIAGAKPDPSARDLQEVAHAKTEQPSRSTSSL